MDLDNALASASGRSTALRQRAAGTFDLRPDPGQRVLLGRAVRMVVPLRSGTNGLYRARFEDGGAAIYKPAAEETRALRDNIAAGTYWRSEIAAYVTDQLLGFCLVPTTAAADLGRGMGSLQEWAGTTTQPAGPSRLVHMYSPEDIQRMAVLDYVVGNTDRHAGNWLTGGDGRPIAVDNGLSFPTSASSPLRSGFFATVLDRPLAGAVVAGVGGVAAGAYVETLLRCGLSQPAVDAAADRLLEAQAGMISGRAWTRAGGDIVDEYWDTLRSSGETRHG